MMLGLGHRSGALDAFFSRDNRQGIGEATTCQIYAIVSSCSENSKKRSSMLLFMRSGTCDVDSQSEESVEVGKT